VLPAQKYVLPANLAQHLLVLTVQKIVKNVMMHRPVPNVSHASILVLIKHVLPLHLLNVPNSNTKLKMDHAKLAMPDANSVLHQEHVTNVKHQKLEFNLYTPILASINVKMLVKLPL